MLRSNIIKTFVPKRPMYNIGESQGELNQMKMYKKRVIDRIKQLYPYRDHTEFIKHIKTLDDHRLIFFIDVAEQRKCRMLNEIDRIISINVNNSRDKSGMSTGMIIDPFDYDMVSVFIKNLYMKLDLKTEFDKNMFKSMIARVNRVTKNF